MATNDASAGTPASAPWNSEDTSKPPITPFARVAP